MVARKQSADAAAKRMLTGLFDAWRRLLGAAYVGIRTGLTTANRHLATPGRGPAAIQSSGMIAMGAACLLGGVVMGVAFAPPGPPTTAEALAGIVSTIWAVARLALIGATSAGLRRDGRTLVRAWALGLIPWLIGVTPSLRAVAWVMSALVTWLVLAKMTTRDDARRAIVIAWGTQAAFTILVWLARNILTIWMGVA